MAKDIEKTLKHCKKCTRKTVHYRNTDKTGLLMLVVHIALIIFTAGIWLALIIIYKLLNMKIGGFTCSECK